ncbi:hypothetical protein K9M06_00375 [Candidatus Bipolaricaulota bacterium]|nr:hypothetical protein [Candidatus Bipolaricaulota bacterium]
MFIIITIVITLLFDDIKYFVCELEKVKIITITIVLFKLTYMEEEQLTPIGATLLREKKKLGIVNIGL